MSRRLLYVINETYFFLSHRLPVARAAQEAGFEVHVAAPDDHVWAPDGFSVDEIAKAGFTYHRVPLSRRGTDPLQEAHTFAAINALYRELRPALVHNLTIKPVLYGGVAARLAGVPAVVAGVTGLGQMFTAPGWRMGLMRRAATAAYRFAASHPRSRFIVQNREDGEILARLGAVPERNIRLIRGSGVDLAGYTPAPEPESERPLVILPARLIWEKGVGEFVAAARIIRARGVPARLALVGDTKSSNPRAVPEAQLRAWAEEGVVEWWGRRDDMPEVLRQSAIVCLPSTYGEGVPKALIEAAAVGRPIVATDAGGCREIVREGENGLLVRPREPAELAEALIRLLTDRALRNRLGERGRKIAETEFSDRDVAAKTLEVYREIVD
ncbi:MAG: glycosyltransferase family 4 protein [Alphaproteobacteria bacterium]|nr:glycosyltransferase family 4 protein [Alphaproteobacteria bacterium]